jgi:hypothetical protein
MRTAIAIATLLACGSVSLHAQAAHRPDSRQGFWIGFGLGDGSRVFKCTFCTTDRSGGLSGYARLGGTLSRHVLLGFEAIGWRRSEDFLVGSSAESHPHESISYGSVILLWYPSRTGPLYLKAGLGGMRYRWGNAPVGGDVEYGATVLTTTRPSASLGIGYEVRLGRNFSLVPYLNGLASSAVQEDVVGFNSFFTTGDVTITLVQFGLGVTWY